MNKKLAADIEAPVFAVTQDDLARIYRHLHEYAGFEFVQDEEPGDWSELWQEDWMPPAGACGGGECVYSEGLWSLCKLHTMEVTGCVNP